MADKDRPAGSEDGEPEKDAQRDEVAEDSGTPADASAADAQPEDDVQEDATEGDAGASEVEAQPDSVDADGATDRAEDTAAPVESGQVEPTSEVEARNVVKDGTAPPDADETPEAGASAVEARPGAGIDDPAFADDDRDALAGDATTDADTESDRDEAEAADEEPVQPTPWAAAAGAAVAGTAGGAVADSSARAAAQPEASPQAEPTRDVVVKRGGFFPALLGGILAAILGFAAARYVVPEGWPFPGAATPSFQETTRAALGEQAAEIQALRADLAAAEPDLSPVEDRIAALEGRLADVAEGQDELSGTLGGRLSEIESRLTEIEKRPMEAALSQEAIEAYERELQALMDQVAAQRSEIESIASEATSREQQAAEAARRAAALSALARVTTALDAGEPYAAALAELSATMEQPVPDGLQAGAQDGVPTRAELDSGFASAARGALAAARDADAPPEDPADRLGAFLRERLGARSVTPREGGDADAILSRAEAALRRGELGAALDELSALPEPAQAELAEWTAAAQTRHAAVQAAARLNDMLNEE